MDKGSSSRASSSRARELRARRRLNAKTGVELLDVLPPDILVHILVLLPTTRDLCQMDMVCRLFAFGTSEFGRQSLVEAALRIRHFAQTGLAVPGDLIREPWWPWASTKAKLVHDERCRRGVRLEPLVPDTVVNSDMDQRKGIVFFRRAGPGQPPPEMLLGRMTRALDNGQGIQDPRVSRQHLRISLAQGEAYEPNGVCRVQALGHNPSTIKRGKLASLGLGFHAEGMTQPPQFKLRRGDVSTLYPGDTIQLVCEDVSRAHGRSLPFEGNSCSYLVQYLGEKDEQYPEGTVVVGRETEDTDEEGSLAGEPAAEGGHQPGTQSQSQLV